MAFKGSVLRRVFDLREEVREFLINSENFSHFEDDNFIAKVAYLSDIFEHFNKLNLSLQSNDNILDVSDRIRGFIDKLIVWKKELRKILMKCLSLFKVIAIIMI